MAGLPNITINGSNAVSARFFFPYKGVWFADVDVDPIAAQAFLTRGPAALVVGTFAAIGTIDPSAGGRFGAIVRVRVVGGGNGWDSLVPPQHFHSPAGVLSTLVYTSTAALVQEVAVDMFPKPLGTDFVRSMGPASRILQEKDWHVDPISGTTFIGPRVPVTTPDPSLEILGYDPLTNRFEAACDVPVMPGTPLVDTSGNTPPRWDGILTAVDVEHVFSSEGNRATIWASSSLQPVTRLISALQSLMREGTTREFIRAYKAVFVIPSGGDVALQPSDPTLGVPPMVPLKVWGPAGYKATYTPGAFCAVQFLNGDPSNPVVTAWDTTPPLTVSIDAAVKIDIGPLTAPLINLGGGLNPLVPTPWAAALTLALTALAGGLASATTVAQVAAAGTAFATALLSLPLNATIKVKAT